VYLCESWSVMGSLRAARTGKARKILDARFRDMDLRKMSLCSIVRRWDFYFEAGNLFKISWIKGDEFET
jgi:hypothetical protein